MVRNLVLSAFVVVSVGALGQSGASWLDADFELANTVPPLDPMGSEKKLPFDDAPFVEHVRVRIPGSGITGVTDLFFDENNRLVATAGGIAHVLGKDGTWTERPNPAPADPAAPSGLPVWVSAQWGRAVWYATANGLYISSDGASSAERYEQYGVNGPLATDVAALVLVNDAMYVGTPLGISVCTEDGTWTAITGDDGLPFEDVTALAADSQGRIWIGTTEGAILYAPGDAHRTWYYRWGERYLPGSIVSAIAIAADDTPYFATDGGIGAIALKQTTLLEKAESIEARVNERHRRLGLVAPCTLDDPFEPTTFTISDGPNDGLWTAYHVAAMALAYGATGDPAAKASATTGMEALYMLQNVTGIPGLPARSVVPIEDKRPEKGDWHRSPDGKFFWRGDTSSDEIDGHYLAFYTYWTHIAKDDPAKREQCIAQVRAMTDYIVDNGYQLIDVTGERTTWGIWDPESLNDDPERYLENGLNALQMLSFLKTAHTITGDEKYDRHYQSLIVDHGYLSNLLTAKKVFPDENNHSDNQLGHVAWYPILQQETDPRVRAALHAGIRRHYRIVEPEKPSFFIFTYATIDPTHADIAAGLENLRETPEDRRAWPMHNSQRTDVDWNPRLDRMGNRQLMRVLPADERHFQKWNQNPYLADDGDDGHIENDGAAYLLPYWMGRYHGFIAAAR